MRNGPYELVVAPPDYPGMHYRGRYCYEHHLVYWRAHGVVPEPGQVIHHIDGDKRHNVATNLELMEAGEHSTEHLLSRPKKPTVHGTDNAYKHRGCRCAICKRASADRMNEWRWRTGRRKESGRKPAVHGSSSMYSYHKCRCAECREGNRIRAAKYRNDSGVRQLGSRGGCYPLMMQVRPLPPEPTD